MGKQKTHKASSKVIKVRKNGTVSYKKSGGNHKTAKDPRKAVRQRRNKGILAKGDTKSLRDFI